MLSEFHEFVVHPNKSEKFKNFKKEFSSDNKESLLEILFFLLVVQQDIADDVEKNRDEISSLKERIRSLEEELQS